MRSVLGHAGLAATVLPSKAALYRILGFDATSYSKDKRNAIDRHIAQYMKVVSTNNPRRKREIEINAIYKNKKSIEDRRHHNKGSNNNKYSQYSAVILMDYISLYAFPRNDGYYIATFTKKELKSMLLDTYIGDNLFYKKGELYGLSLYKEKLNKALEQAIEAGLKKLEREKYIKWDYNWVVVSRKKQENKTLLAISNQYGYSYAASKKDVDYINELTDQFCTHKGCTPQSLWRNHFYDYTSFLSESLFSALGYENAFREYIITIKDMSVLKDNIPQDEIIEERKQQLKRLLSNMMSSVVFDRSYKKFSKKSIEQFKLSEPELFELFYSDMEKEKSTIYDDYSNAMPIIKKLHYSLFDEQL